MPLLVHASVPPQGAGLVDGDPRPSISPPGPFSSGIRWWRGLSS